MYFITVANKPKPELDILKKSCELNGIELKVLGLDMPNIKIGHGIGFGQKLMLLRNYLQNLNNNDIFVFVDAYDVVVTCDAKEILTKFLSFNTKILFSAEKYCWPDQNKTNKYKINNTNQPNFLNSGTFMAYVQPFKQFYDENSSIINEQTDDQRYYTNLYLKYQNNPNFITLDRESKIFMCLAGSNDIKFDPVKNRYRNTKTNQYPCIIHANGGKKDFIYEHSKKIITNNKINLVLVLCFLLLIAIIIYYCL